MKGRVYFRLLPEPDNNAHGVKPVLPLPPRRAVKQLLLCLCSFRHDHYRPNPEPPLHVRIRFFPLFPCSTP